MKKKLSQLERDTAAWYENLSEDELRDREGARESYLQCPCAGC